MVRPKTENKQDKTFEKILEKRETLLRDTSLPPPSRYGTILLIYSVDTRLEMNHETGNNKSILHNAEFHVFVAG